MQIKHANLSSLARKTDFLATPTVILFSEREARKEKWLALLPEEVRARVIAARDRLQARANEQGAGESVFSAGARFALHGRAPGEEDLWFAVLPAEAEAFFLLEFARDTLRDVLHPGARALRVILAGEDHAAELADALGAACAARVFRMPTYGKRKEKEKPFRLERVEIVASRKRLADAFERGRATGDGTNLARELATLPPNQLNPAQYGEIIRKVCKENGIACKFHSRAELKKMGAGAFLAVDRGDPNSAGGIYELEYAPKKGKPRRTIHLAGKGICFDTGGYDVKTGGHMISMKGDMQGSAVALATLVTAAKLKLPYRLKAFLAVTENHLSPEAYKPDEVITALNGTSIEIINTDAEGRMVLADTLTLASRGKPHCLVDFATLTGAAVRALGTKYAAGFTNREPLHERILKAGRVSGERVWTFPTDSSFHKALESKIADTVQCVRSGPDHILAACFLSRFIEDGTPWVHVDLACSENEGGLAHVDSLYTGFGVRWALEFMSRI